jgi:hypothetical protein
MSLVWEEDFDVFAKDIPKSLTWHLKRLMPGKDPTDIKPYNIMTGPYKVSLAWVRKTGERKYDVHFTYAMHGQPNKTFRSLKQAKAYALAIATLEAK